MKKSSYRSLGPHGFHRVEYLEWGNHNNPRAVVCVHGLTRNAHDFDALAERLADRYRVIAVDVVGRGGSDRLTHAEDYGYPLYLQDMAALVARLDVEQVDWVGTSMGGLIGMLLAVQPGNPIRRLVLNDVGPFLPVAALERICEYIGKDPEFENLEALEQYLRTVHAPFGPLTDIQWQKMAACSGRRGEDGKYHLSYDPAIARPILDQPLEDVSLWEVWDLVRCQCLLLRGAESDVLLAETAQEMRSRGPGVELVEFEGIGHAPALMESDQIDVIGKWLDAG